MGKVGQFKASCVGNYGHLDAFSCNGKKLYIRNWKSINGFFSADIALALEELALLLFLSYIEH